MMIAFRHFAQRREAVPSRRYWRLYHVLRSLPCIYVFESNGQYFSLAKIEEEPRVPGQIENISPEHYTIL